MGFKKIGLALSGGGVKALAHAGFLKVLLENGIAPHVLSGTSGGALVAALYAQGYQPDEMPKFFKETPMFKFSLFALNKPGIMDSEKYSSIFKNYFKAETFEQLNLPITITATNISTGKLQYFSKGELIKPLIASSALPPYFSPIEIEGELFSDGGILNNFPTEPLKKKCDLLLGSFVNPVNPIEKKDVNNTLKYISRVYHVGMDAAYYRKFKSCNYVFLPPEIDKIGLLDTKMIDKAYQIGYDHATSEIKKVLEEVESSI